MRMSLYRELTRLDQSFKHTSTSIIPKSSCCLSLLQQANVYVAIYIWHSWRFRQHKEGDTKLYRSFTIAVLRGPEVWMWVCSSLYWGCL